jgi:endonuclease III
MMAARADAQRHADQIARALAKHYPDAACSLDFHSPLELLVATILSAQCTDTRVNQVTKSLFRKYPTAAHYARASLGELERDIQSTGFFRNKAKSIQNCCRTLLESYGGEVPKDIAQLVELPGVGRKTANVVLGTAYGIASGVVVDTHVARISRRLGLSRQKNPEKIEKDLMGQFAQRQWIALSHRLIHHGRRYCTARNPKCDECPLESLCPKIGVKRR